MSIYRTPSIQSLDPPTPTVLLSRSRSHHRGRNRQGHENREQARSPSRVREHSDSLSRRDHFDHDRHSGSDHRYSRRRDSVDERRSRHYGASVSLATATDEDLRRAGNTAYLNLLCDYNKLDGRYIELKHLVATLSTSRTVAPPMLAPLSGSSEGSFPAYDGAPVKKGLELVVFWSPQDFAPYQPARGAKGFDPTEDENLRGGGRMRQGVNVRMRYLEMERKHPDEPPNFINGRIAEEIRAYTTKQVLEYTQTRNVDIPTGSRSIPVMMEKFVLDRVYQKYPYVRLCLNHWKGRKLLGCVLNTMTSSSTRRDKKSESPSRASSSSKRKAPQHSDDDPIAFESHKRQHVEPTVSKAALPLAASEKTPTITPRSSPQPDSAAAGVVATTPESARPVPLPTLEAPQPLAASSPSSPLDPNASGAAAGKARDTTGIGNPLEELFGAAQAPSMRSQAIKAIKQKQVVKAGKKKAQDAADVSNPLPTRLTRATLVVPVASGSGTNTAVPETSTSNNVDTNPKSNGKLKKVTESTSSKNLFYKDYLKTHDAISTSQFDALWNRLAPRDRKKWGDVSKASKPMAGSGTAEGSGKD